MNILTGRVQAAVFTGLKPDVGYTIKVCLFARENTYFFFCELLCTALTALRFDTILNVRQSKG